MKKRNCDFCDSNDFIELFKARDINQRTSTKEYKLVRCKNCGFVFINPQPTSKELQKSYPKTYYPKKILTGDYYFYQMDKLKKISEFYRNGKILDIGCGIGGFLKLARDRGWLTFGVEISSEASRYGEEQFGLDIYNGDFLNSNFTMKDFDVIMLWHVLEHLQKPNEVIKKVFNILKEDGLIVIAVPNFDSFQAKCFKENWYHLDVPRHLCQFTPNIIKSALEKNGFKIVKIDYFSKENNATGIEFSIVNYIRSKGLTITHTSLSINRTLKGVNFASRYLDKLRKGLFLKVIVNVVHYLSKPLAYIESVLKRGGTFEIYAIKRREKND